MSRIVCLPTHGHVAKLLCFTSMILSLCVLQTCCIMTAWVELFCDFLMFQADFDVSGSKIKPV